MLEVQEDKSKKYHVVQEKLRPRHGKVLFTKLPIGIELTCQTFPFSHLQDLTTLGQFAPHPGSLSSSAQRLNVILSPFIVMHCLTCLKG